MEYLISIDIIYSLATIAFFSGRVIGLEEQEWYKVLPHLFFIT